MFTVAPFVLMILFLVLTSSDLLKRSLMLLPSNLSRWTAQAIQSTPPAALGKLFEQD
jgi:simple sugar transport system permease protein